MNGSSSGESCEDAEVGVAALEVEVISRSSVPMCMAVKISVTPMMPPRIGRCPRDWCGGLASAALRGDAELALPAERRRWQRADEV